jgi:hypothetical protein
MLIQKAAPVLPAYLQATCYLATDLCPEWTHRYHQTALTLRYRDDHGCVQCVTQRAVDRLERRA